MIKKLFVASVFYIAVMGTTCVGVPLDGDGPGYWPEYDLRTT